MNPNDFRRHGHEMVEWIANYLETVRDRRVLPDVKPGEVFDRLPAHGPNTAEPFEQIMQDFESQILTGSTLWNHPRFFSYFAISSTPPSILAEFLAAAINQNGILWKSGPALTELEQVTLGWLREWLGLPPEYFGIIYDTASVSTLHALIAARQFVVPDTRRHGARHDLVVYTSDQAHSSIEKGALALGFGEDNVRKIATDETFAIRLDLLEAAIQKDLTEGRVPCCVVACVGATPTASVDPIAQVITLARHYGMWIHVDAAYAGPAAMLPECAPHFAGWDHADSIVMNPQKWMLTNVDISVLYLRHKEALSDAIGLTPEYLRTTADPRMLNYMDYSVALGRRFRALKLWFVMRSYGRDGISEMLRRHNADAQWLRQQIEADPRFEISAPTHFSLVCFRLKAANEVNQRLLDAVNQSGFAFIAHTVQNGQYVLRFAIGNYMTTRDDIAQTWARIQELSATLV